MSHSVLKPQRGIRNHRLNAMTGGWFVGAFSPTAYHTSDVEVALQTFPAGYLGAPHHHLIATEITLLISGEALMAGERLSAGDIIVLEPGVSSSFEALTDCIAVVVKHPGAPNDKYLDQDNKRC